MAAKVRMSPTLNVVRDGATAHVCCARCGHRLVGAGEPWKPAARLRERPSRAIGGVHVSPESVVIREFSCPSCRALLDTETALLGDPFLDDVLRV